MESSQGNKLELVTHLANLLLELGNGGIIQMSLPVEGWRAVVSQQLACRGSGDDVKLPTRFSRSSALLIAHVTNDTQQIKYNEVPYRFPIKA